MRDSKRTISTILEAAERVIVQSGVEKTTIDEVAREAGVSKGGVLHHFPSKEAILVGLVSMMIEKFDAEVQTQRSHDPEPAGSFTRALLGAVTSRDDDHCVEVFVALQAAFRNTPPLQQVLRKAHLKWQALIEKDGINPVSASVVRLATDGLWLAKIRGVAVPSEKYRKELLEFLVALTRTPSIKGKPKSKTRPKPR
jgi:AcrR family transcriptional regulator